MHLNTDRTLLMVDLNDGLDAGAVDDLITELATFRSIMAPAFDSALPPELLTSLDTDSVLHEVFPEREFQRLPGGVGRLFLRNSGLGWLSFDLALIDLRTILLDLVGGG